MCAHIRFYSCNSLFSALAVATLKLHKNVCCIKTGRYKVPNIILFVALLVLHDAFSHRRGAGRYPEVFRLTVNKLLMYLANDVCQRSTFANVSVGEQPILQRRHVVEDIRPFESLLIVFALKDKRHRVCAAEMFVERGVRIAKGMPHRKALGVVVINVDLRHAPDREGSASNKNR